MKEDNNNKPEDSKPKDKETEASIANGKKAIDIQEKTAPAEAGKQADNKKADAEKWRNEG